MKSKLKPCPCGEVPKSLIVSDIRDNSTQVCGSCCDKFYGLELQFSESTLRVFRDDQLIALAVKAWDNAPWNGKRFQMSDKVLVPKTLKLTTADKENFGEFTEVLNFYCSECNSEVDFFDCEFSKTAGRSNCNACGGSGYINHYVKVSWKNINAIYKRAVKVLEAKAD